MAQTKSPEVTNLDATPVVYNDVRDWHGRVRVQRASITLNANAVNDTIKLVRLPLTAKVVSIKVWMEANASSSTFDIGDSEVENRYCTDQAGSAALNGAEVLTLLGTATLTGSVGFQIANAAEQDILMTWEGATATSSAKLCIVEVFYTLD